MAKNLIKNFKNKLKTLPKDFVKAVKPAFHEGIVIRNYTKTGKKYKIPRICYFQCLDKYQEKPIGLLKEPKKQEEKMDDLTTVKGYTLKFYKSGKKKEWRWRLSYRGKIVVSSSESFGSKNKATRNLEASKKALNLFGG